jgi:hypothetical protein
MECRHKVALLEQSTAVSLDFSSYPLAGKKPGMVNTAGCPHNLNFSSYFLLTEPGFIRGAMYHVKNNHLKFKKKF